jgi:hypothetical protein
MMAQPSNATTIIENFTLSGTATMQNNDEISSSSLDNFDTSLGTLTEVELSFSGTATPHDINANDLDTAQFLGVGESGTNFGLISATGAGNGPFAISANGNSSNPAVLDLFEATGPQAIVLFFNLAEGTLSATGSGTVTYVYTAADLPVPEPADVGTFAVGLVALFSVWRFRRQKR